MLVTLTISALALHLPSAPPVGAKPTLRPAASFDPLGLQTGIDAPQPAFAPPRDVAALAVSLATLAATQPEPAFAKGGEYGIFEGRIISLAHPVRSPRAASQSPSVATCPFILLRPPQLLKLSIK